MKDERSRAFEDMYLLFFFDFTEFRMQFRLVAHTAEVFITVCLADNVELFGAIFLAFLDWAGMEKISNLISTCIS